VPDITPVEEFNVIPEGKDEPFCSEYVTDSEGSVADTATDMVVCSPNVPRDPEAVTHVGAALDVILNVREIGVLTPSEALIVNV
jgi:hypothetical protein